MSVWANYSCELCSELHVYLCDLLTSVSFVLAVWLRMMGWEAKYTVDVWEEDLSNWRQKYFILILRRDERGKNKRFSVRFETWMWNCWICKWVQFIFSQELSIIHYPKQVGSYLRHHFNIISKSNHVTKSSVPHTRFVWGIWFDFSNFTHGQIALLEVPKTTDHKCFSIFTQ